MAVTPAAELYHLSCEFIIVQTTAAAVFHGLVTAVIPSESLPYGSNLVDCCCPLLELVLLPTAAAVPALLHACVNCCWCSCTAACLRRLLLAHLILQVQSG